MSAPLLTAEGGIALAEEHLRIMLADGTRFRTWAQDAANRDEALARIYSDGLPDPPEDRETYTAEEMRALRPFAIVLTARQAGFSKARIATGVYAEAGKLAIAFEENVPEKYSGDPAALERSFKNTLGVIVDQLLDLAYTAPDEDSQYLAIDIVTFHGPMRCSQQEAVGEGDHHFAMLEIQYGVGVR